MKAVGWRPDWIVLTPSIMANMHGYLVNLPRQQVSTTTKTTKKKGEDFVYGSN
jgi:hypothetical protein